MQISLLLSHSTGGNASTRPSYLLFNITFNSGREGEEVIQTRLLFQHYLQLVTDTKQRAATMPVYMPTWELHTADQLLVNMKAMVKLFTYIVPYLV